MKKLLLGLALLGSFTACQKEEDAPAAVPGFVFRNSTAEALTIATHDTCSLFDRSQYAQSVAWDFGNGVTSAARRPVLSYDKPGTYTVTRTTTNGEGRKSAVSKTVQVLDMVVKRIVLNRPYWFLAPIPNFNSTWPKADEADVYVQIQHVNQNRQRYCGAGRYCRAGPARDGCAAITIGVAAATVACEAGLSGSGGAPLAWPRLPGQCRSSRYASRCH